MNRRRFLQSTGLTAISASTGAPALAADQPAEPFAIRVGPYLQNPAAGAMSVMWLTTAPAFGYVEYGPTPALGQVAHAEVDGLRQANTTIHRVRLANLKPGQRVHYRVVSRPFDRYAPYHIDMGPQVTSPVQQFCAPDVAAERVRFLVFNDLHDNVKLWRELYALVADEKDVDFVFLNGDVTDYLTDERQMVDHFLAVCSDTFAARVPFLYARGNHETRGAFSRRMKDYLDLPGDRYYYALTWGPARFVVLDTGEDKRDATPVYAGLCAFDDYRDRQRAFLADEMKFPAWTTAPRRIAIQHIPPFYNDPDSDDHPDNYTAVQIRQQWHPILKAGNPHLFLAGHTHKPVIHPRGDQHGFPIVIGGGPKKGIGTVMIVDVTREKISVKVLNDDGSTLGTVTA
jgi:predicted phosphodiesterase